MSYSLQQAVSGGNEADQNRVYASPVSGGELLVAAISVYSNTVSITGVSDQLNGAWSLAVTGSENSSLVERPSIYYFRGSAAGTPSVTVALSGAAGTRICLYSLTDSGTIPASPLDLTATNQGTPTPSLTLGDVADRAFTIAYLVTADGTVNAPGSWTLGNSGASNWNEFVFHILDTSNTGIGDSIAPADASGQWTMCAASFKSSDSPVGGGAVENKIAESQISVQDSGLSPALRNAMQASSVQLIDEVSKFARIARLAGSSITSVDEGPAFRQFIMDATDSIDVTDSQLYRMVRSRVLSDGFSAFDEAIANTVTAAIVTRILESSIVPSDGLAAWASRTRETLSGIDITDAIQRARALAVLVTDTVDTLDEQLSYLTRYLALDDALFTEDGIQSTYLPSLQFSPRIMIGTNQPNIEIGGYAL